MAQYSKSSMRTASVMRSGERCETVHALVVDDDAFTMKMVGNMVEALGFNVDLANGGIEAQGMVSRGRYALVLTDYQMPEVDGYDLAVWIKERWQDTRVFIMTGCSPAEVADVVGNGAVDRWMHKPFDLVQLKTALAAAALCPA